MVNDKENIEPKRRKGLFGSRKAAVTPPAATPIEAPVETTPVETPPAAPVAQSTPVEKPAEPAVTGVDDIIVDEVVVKAAA